MVIEESANAAANVSVTELGVKGISAMVSSDAILSASEQPVDDKNEVDSIQVPSLEENVKSTTLNDKTIQDPFYEIPIFTSGDVGYTSSPKSVEMVLLDSYQDIENQGEFIYELHPKEKQNEMEQFHMEEYATEKTKADNFELNPGGLDSKEDQRDEPFAEPQGTPPPSYQAFLRSQSGERCGKIEAQSPGLEVSPSTAVLQENQQQQQEFNDPVPSASFDQSDVKPFTSSAIEPSPNVCKDSSVHQIKWIHFNGVKVPVITQNENGPCPMIAITNVLLLRRKLCLSPEHEVVSSDLIIASLSEELLSYPTTVSWAF